MFPGAGQTYLQRFLDDAGTQWSMGTLGAIAEFARDPGEPNLGSVGKGQIALSTARGAIRLHGNPVARLIATETLGRDAGTWRHSVSICLPHAAAAMHGRSGLAEIGPDLAAVREEDRESLLFDLGLALPQTDVCVRTRDAGLIALLRANLGKPLFGPDHAALMALIHHSPHRVFQSRLGRIEVFQPIPEASGKSPAGPHTHLLPKLLRAQRTHAATVPIPSGMVPCAVFYPPHPLFDGEGMPRPLVRAHVDAFADLLGRFGIPELVALQGAVARAVRAGAPPQEFRQSLDRFARASLRIVLRKLRATDEASPNLDRWIEAFDRGPPEAIAEDAANAC